MTREELNALPDRTVIVSDGRAYQKEREHQGDVWYGATCWEGEFYPELDFDIKEAKEVWRP